MKGQGGKSLIVEQMMMPGIVFLDVSVQRGGIGTMDHALSFGGGQGTIAR